MLRVPCAIVHCLWAADRNAIGPRLVGLFGEAEIGAADSEGTEAVLVGILVGFFETIGSPIGTSERPDLAGGVILVEYFHNGADRYIGIVAMEDVDVEEIRT